MYEFIDNWMPDSIELAYQFEQNLHRSILDYSDKSDSDRRRCIEVLKYIDSKVGMSSVRLDTAYDYLSNCSSDVFWTRGLKRLIEVRQDIWDKLLNGS